MLATATFLQTQLINHQKTFYTSSNNNTGSDEEKDVEIGSPTKSETVPLVGDETEIVSPDSANKES